MAQRASAKGYITPELEETYHHLAANQDKPVLPSILQDESLHLDMFQGALQADHPTTLLESLLHDEGFRKTATLWLTVATCTTLPVLEHILNYYPPTQTSIPPSKEALCSITDVKVIHLLTKAFSTNPSFKPIDATDLKRVLKIDNFAPLEYILQVTPPREIVRKDLVTVRFASVRFASHLVFVVVLLWEASFPAEQLSNWCIFPPCHSCLFCIELRVLLSVFSCILAKKKSTDIPPVLAM